MEKIYGFKQRDIVALLDYLGKREGEPLSRVFSAFAEKSGKSKGTVRNMYYAIARKSREDAEFADKYLGGKPFEVQKVAEFNGVEERDLVKKVLEGKRKGKSVRAVIAAMSGGDEKLALRYQNKYRNIIKNKTALVAEVVEELRGENGEVYDPVGLNPPRPNIPDVQLKRLQKEINGLLDRVTGKLKRENIYLKNRLNEVEIENIRLKNALYGIESGKNAANFFKKGIDKNILN